MKFSEAKIESGIPGTPLGNPIARLVGSTSSACHFASWSLWPSSCPRALPSSSSSSSSQPWRSRSFAFSGVSVGHWLGGGGVPCMTQSRSATRMRFTSAVAGTGFALSVPTPQLLPGHPAPTFGMASFKPPSVRLPPP